MLNVSVIGLGFVGLTTSLGLAKKGHRVVGYDCDVNKQNSLANGHIPFHEPSLAENLHEMVGKTFSLANNMADAVNVADVIMFCVGTPQEEDGKVDLSHIQSAIDEVLTNLPPSQSTIFCIKSTVPPSSCRDQIKPLLAGRESIRLCNNPEFLREGYAWDDFMNPDRIVIGVEDVASESTMQDLYSGFDAPIHFVTLNEAEYIKYLSNTLLATMISYSNEMAMFAEQVGDIRVSHTFKLLHQDKRWFGNPAGISSYVFPGCGFGGYCLPKDLSAMIQIARMNGLSAPLLSAAQKTNHDIAEFWAQKIASSVSNNQKIAWLGLSFKPNSSDTRQTPVLPIIRRLMSMDYHNITAYDPMGIDEFKLYNPDLSIHYAEDFSGCIEKADVIIIATAWDEFVTQLNSDSIATPIIDLRYCLN